MQIRCPGPKSDVAIALCEYNFESIDGDALLLWGSDTFSCSLSSLSWPSFWKCVHFVFILLSVKLSSSLMTWWAGRGEHVVICSPSAGNHHQADALHFLLCALYRCATISPPFFILPSMYHHWSIWFAYAVFPSFRLWFWLNAWLSQQRPSHMMYDGVEMYLHVTSHYINTLLMVRKLFMTVRQCLMQLLYANLHGPILIACKGRQ